MNVNIRYYMTGVHDKEAEQQRLRRELEERREQMDPVLYTHTGIVAIDSFGKLSELLLQQAEEEAKRMPLPTYEERQRGPKQSDRSHDFWNYGRMDVYKVPRKETE